MLDKNVIDQLIIDIGDDVFLRLSGQFLDETINRLALLASCREKEAWTDLARHAHSLKSTAQSFGLPETGQRARLLETFLEKFALLVRNHAFAAHGAATLNVSPSPNFAATLFGNSTNSSPCDFITPASHSAFAPVPQ